MIKIKALSLGNYLSENLNTSSTKDFYLDFSDWGTGVMKNQKKIKKVGFGDLNQETSENVFSDEVHQVILGSLFGDMYCGKEAKNSVIQEAHSINQKDYLFWKHSLLKNELNLKIRSCHYPICKDKGKVYKRKEEVRLRSKVSSKLNYYHTLFYQNGKKRITQKILNQLDSLGLAVWHCDDGHYDSENRTISLHTEGFSQEENRITQQWFYERWGLKPSFKRHGPKGKIALRFSKNDSEKFLLIIKNHIFSMPQSIWYKLGHLWEGNLIKIKEANLNKKRRTKVYQSKKEVKARRNEQAKDFYRKNREKILKEKAEYRKTKKYKDYIKKYHQKEYIKGKKKAKGDQN